MTHYCLSEAGTKVGILEPTLQSLLDPDRSQSLGLQINTDLKSLNLPTGPQGDRNKVW